MARKRPAPEPDATPTSRNKLHTSRASKQSSSPNERTSSTSKRKPRALKQPRTSPPAMETTPTTPPPRDLKSPPPSKKRKKHARFADPVAVSFFPIASAVQSPPRTARKPSRYTFEFFQDMVETVASHFPFEAFAAKHGVSLHDVSQAFSAVVVAPLTDPAFLWHDDPDMTIPEYAEIMIGTWNDHFKETLLIHAAAAAIDHDNETVTSEDSDESCNAQDNDTNFADLCGSKEASPLAQDNQSTNLPSPVHGSQTSAKERPSGPPAKKVQRALYPKWTPSATPAVRQRVYRDEFGNFARVPTAEEQEENQRREWGREQSQRNRGRQGRSHTSRSQTMDISTIEVDPALEEWFERELAASADMGWMGREGES